MPDIHTGVIEGLYASDLAYLQRLYDKLNAVEPDEQELAAGAPARHQRPSSAEGCCPGGSMRAYPVKSLYEEMAFIAYHFHWSHDDLMQLEHRERRRWCREISSINRALDGAPANPFEAWKARQ